MIERFDSDGRLEYGDRIPSAADIQALATLMDTLPDSVVIDMFPKFGPVIEMYCQQFRKPTEA